MTIQIDEPVNKSCCFLCGRKWQHILLLSPDENEPDLLTVEHRMYCPMCRDLLAKREKYRRLLNAVETDIEYFLYMKQC